MNDTINILAYKKPSYIYDINFKQIVDDLYRREITEIDLSKAYTYSFSKIDKVPLFNEFDTFTKYDNSEIEDYTLYIIKTSKTSLLFNKVFNLCYGMFLKPFINDTLDILAYKKPSFLYDVNFKQIVDDLYSSEISDNAFEDKYIKKLIANVNIGLLEKGVNKNNKSEIFDSYNEAKHYQEAYDGRIIDIKREIISIRHKP
jgi:hypothetical protein